MRKNTPIDPLLPLSLAELLACYVKDGLLRRPDTFGLPDFAVASLRERGFDREGDDTYCLYEKSYRSADSTAGVHLKIYIEHGVAASNGIDIWPSTRLETCLLDLKRCTAPELIRTVEIVVFDDKRHGSLLINDELVLRFSANGKSRRNKYRVVGLSTNARFDTRTSPDRGATCFARSYNDLAIGPGEAQRHRRHPALRSLIGFLETHFGHAFNAP